MAIFAKHAIEVGHRFTKVGSFRSAVWRVARIIQREPEVPHVNLEREGNARDSITVSMQALADATLFRRVTD